MHQNLSDKGICTAEQLVVPTTSDYLLLRHDSYLNSPLHRNEAKPGQSGTTVRKMNQRYQRHLSSYRGVLQFMRQLKCFGGCFVGVSHHLPAGFFRTALEWSRESFQAEASRLIVHSLIMPRWGKFPSYPSFCPCQGPESVQREHYNKCYQEAGRDLRAAARARPSNVVITIPAVSSCKPTPDNRYAPRFEYKVSTCPHSGLYHLTVAEKIHTINYQLSTYPEIYNTQQALYCLDNLTVSLPCRPQANHVVASLVPYKNWNGENFAFAQSMPARSSALSVQSCIYMSSAIRERSSRVTCLPWQ